MNKFEQLIEFVINDDESKARELFHDIVVEKSREIYENLMNEEEQDQEEEELDEAEESDEEGEELDEDQTIGGDASDDLIADVEAEEEGLQEEEGEEEGEEEVEFDAEEESGEDLEDRVVDLEDKLDELMAEFEAMMGSEEGFDDSGEEGDEGIDGELGGDSLEMDDTEEFAPESHGFMEGVDLKAAPKPVTSEESGINTKSTVAANAGAKGPVGGTVKPVTPTGTEAKGRPAPAAKDLGGTTSPKQGPAPKPVTAQASGVNTKSPVSKA